jgi:predicted RNA-binding Zn-ribbon protein involved in translation (DUF1610 family)
MDSPEEWLRLKELYASMNEGELEVVANEAYDLTDIARPLLKDEIARRGLKIALRMERPKRGAAPPASTGFDPSRLDLAVAGTFWDLNDARKVKAFLESAGIPAFWGPKNVEVPDGLGFEEGVDLTVREEDLSRVRGVIGQLVPQEPHDEKEFSFVCPKCHSPEIVFQEMDAETAKFNWSCDACGHEWNDDGVEQAG